MSLSRRSFFTGLAAAFAAPAVVRSGILMPLRGIAMAESPYWHREGNYFMVVHPSMFADLMNDATEIKGISRGELSWWRSISIKSELIPHDPRKVLQHQSCRLRPGLPRHDGAVPFRRDASL